MTFKKTEVAETLAKAMLEAKEFFRDTPTGIFEFVVTSFNALAEFFFDSGKLPSLSNCTRSYIRCFLYRNEVTAFYKPERLFRQWALSSGIHRDIELEITRDLVIKQIINRVLLDLARAGNLILDDFPDLEFDYSDRENPTFAVRRHNTELMFEISDDGGYLKPTEG